jgi:hypothetical protein
MCFATSLIKGTCFLLLCMHVVFTHLSYNFRLSILNPCWGKKIYPVLLKLNDSWLFESSFELKLPGFGVQDHWEGLEYPWCSIWVGKTKKVICSPSWLCGFTGLLNWSLLSIYFCTHRRFKILPDVLSSKIAVLPTNGRLCVPETCSLQFVGQNKILVVHASKGLS